MNETKQAAPRQDNDAAAELARLRAENDRLKAERDAAEARAAAAPGPAGVLIRTTTTKPTDRFRVSAIRTRDGHAFAPVEVSVVDEGEAIRYVATKLGVQPDSCRWQVESLDPERATRLAQADATRQKLYPATQAGVVSSIAS